jgi:hypothetical protein
LRLTSPLNYRATAQLDNRRGRLLRSPGDGRSPTAVRKTGLRTWKPWIREGELEDGAAGGHAAVPALSRISGARSRAAQPRLPKRSGSVGLPALCGVVRTTGLVSTPTPRSNPFQKRGPQDRSAPQTQRVIPVPARARPAPGRPRGVRPPGGPRSSPVATRAAGQDKPAEDVKGSVKGSVPAIS